MSSKNAAYHLPIWHFIASFVILQCSSQVLGEPQVPAMFVFGDSLIDDGNNNYLSSIAKANYYPYGIDFSQGPTGRFCNGKTAIDVLCDLLCLPYLPPYTTPGLNGTRLLGGVNYASAAGGILDETGQHLALYSVGLRKFVLAGMGPLGCIPNQRGSGLAPVDRCVDQINQMVGLFNEGLRSLVQQLNNNHPGAIFVYGNTYGVLGDILNNPSTYGRPL